MRYQTHTNQNGTSWNAVRSIGNGIGTRIGLEATDQSEFINITADDETKHDRELDQVAALSWLIEKKSN